MQKNRSDRAVLLISCTDRPGIIASVASFIAQHGGNVVHAAQHTDEHAGTFFQRVEFALQEFDLSQEGIAPAFQEEVGSRYGMEFKVVCLNRPKRVALMVSKAAHCLYDLLSRAETGELNATVACVISNHTDLESVVARFDRPFYHLPVKPGAKAEQEVAVLDALNQHRVETLVLARYMQVLSPQFLSTWGEPIINIHHSFLPAFPGARPYHRAYERGVKIVGATAHYVTSALDEGPIIEQDVSRVSHRDDVPSIMAKGRDLERMVLARALQWHINAQVLVYANKTVVFGR